MRSLLDPFAMARRVAWPLLGAARLTAATASRGATLLGQLAQDALKAAALAPVEQTDAAQVELAGGEAAGRPSAPVAQLRGAPARARARSSPGEKARRRANPAAAPAATPPPQRVGPPPAEQSAHLGEQPVLVAESADRGAQNGAGAQVRVEEPWPGYAKMKAADVADRLPVEPAAALSVLLLYERSHRARRSLLAAAQRELARRSSAASSRARGPQ